MEIFVQKANHFYTNSDDTAKLLCCTKRGARGDRFDFKFALMQFFLIFSILPIRTPFWLFPTYLVFFYSLKQLFWYFSVACEIFVSAEVLNLVSHADGIRALSRVRGWGTRDETPITSALEAT